MVLPLAVGVVLSVFSPEPPSAHLHIHTYWPTGLPVQAQVCRCQEVNLCRVQPAPTRALRHVPFHSSVLQLNERREMIPET